MKILLIQPPVRDFYQTSIRTQPIGLAYIAASLKSYGYEVEILDCQTLKKRSIPIPPELSYLRDLYPSHDQSPFKLYSGYYHFGMEWGEIKERIKGSKADIFGISSNFTPYHGEALQIAKIIKEWDFRKIVVMGGSHVSCDTENVLRSPLIDYIILGEGEIRFPLLLEQMERGKLKDLERMDGIGYRKNGEIKINPLQNFIQELDSLPYPERSLLDLDRYQMKKRRMTMILTSRGCPHRCGYCSTHRIMGESFRTRTPEAVIEEIMVCQVQYGIQIFDIEDDNFTFDPHRAKRMMNLMIENLGEEKIELSAMNGVSFVSLDEELLKLMKRAGFKTINLSYVSSDSSIKERVGRPGAQKDFNEILKEAERINLNVIAYAILGMPGQTIEEMVDTLIYLMGKKVLIGPSLYYPVPQTLLFKECKEREILPPHPSQWRSSAFPIETEEFDRIDLVTLLRFARLINFIKKKMDEKELDEGITWEELFLRLKKEGPGKKISWDGLVRMIFDQKTFFSLKRGSGKELSISKIGSSMKVFEIFLKKAWKRPIMKSQNNIR